jgi:hypothetical protein
VIYGVHALSHLTWPVSLIAVGECFLELYKIVNVKIGSWDSSVSIATGYGMDDQGEREFESR